MRKKPVYSRAPDATSKFTSRAVLASRVTSDTEFHIAIRSAHAAAARARGRLAHDMRARGSLMHARARATLRRIYYGGCMAEVRSTRQYM